MKQKPWQIPEVIKDISARLEGAGFEAYLVGGCVRDLLLGRKPKDWDITTNAKPDQIQKVFPDSFYDNTFGTVGVKQDTEDLSLKVIQITPYRTEGKYSDKRRPDTVVFGDKLEEDLGRRDFTINAIAYRTKSSEIVDLYDGQKDISKKILRTVGDPDERFTEDPLRMLRAIRLSCELEFMVSQETHESIKDNAGLLKHISKERIRDEFVKVMMSDDPEYGLILCLQLGILPFIAPELLEGVGMEQNQAHAYDVWTHLLKCLKHSAKKAWPLDIRLTALFHDVGKPRTRREGNKAHKWTFYGHDVVGARMVEKILTDLKFSKEIVEKVTSLVRWHMFFSDTEQITPSAVRRLVSKVGKDNIWDLINVRICDRVGTGRPKESPYRLRKYQAMIEEVMRDPVSVGMLAIDGKGIMETTKTVPGPRIGWILHALLEEVLDDPTRNTKDILEKRVLELSALSDIDLKKLNEDAKEKKGAEEAKEIDVIRKKHFVK